MASVGQRLRIVRTALGISQQDLARRAKQHAVTISKVESERTDPRNRTVDALAKALGVSSEALTDDFACVQVVAQALDVQIQPAGSDASAVAKIVEGLRTLLSR